MRGWKHGGRAYRVGKPEADAEMFARLAAARIRDARARGERPRLTFNEWRATGVDVDNLQGAFGFDDGREPIAGRHYADHAAYVERAADGQWLCVCWNDSEHGTLDACERFLFRALDGEAWDCAD